MWTFLPGSHYLEKEKAGAVFTTTFDAIANIKLNKTLCLIANLLSMKVCYEIVCLNEWRFCCDITAV